MALLNPFDGQFRMAVRRLNLISSSKTPIVIFLIEESTFYLPQVQIKSFMQRFS